MFRVPEKYRIDEKTANGMKYLDRTKDQVQKLLEDQAIGNNGWFFLPREKDGRGNYFLVKAMSNVEGEWNMIAVNIPSIGRCATQEELFRISREFWNGSETIITCIPFNQPYVFEQKFWVYMWEYIGTRDIALPPIYGSYASPLAKANKRPFFMKLFIELKKGLTWKKQ